MPRLKIPVINERKIYGELGFSSSTLKELKDRRRPLQRCTIEQMDVHGISRDYAKVLDVFDELIACHHVFRTELNLIGVPDISHVLTGLHNEGVEGADASHERVEAFTMIRDQLTEEDGVKIHNLVIDIFLDESNCKDYQLFDEMELCKQLAQRTYFVAFEFCCAVKGFQQVIKKVANRYQRSPLEFEKANFNLIKGFGFSRILPDHPDFDEVQQLMVSWRAIRRTLPKEVSNLATHDRLLANPDGNTPIHKYYDGWTQRTRVSRPMILGRTRHYLIILENGGFSGIDETDKT